MKKKVILIALLLLFLGLAAGLYYVNTTVLPTFVKQQIITGLSGLTSGKVALEGIHLNIFKGIVVSNITLFDKDNPQEKLCIIKEGSATFLFLPFFKEKKIVVPSLKLKSIALRLVRKQDNSFNISYLIDKFKQPAQAAPAVPAVLVKKIRVADAVILFTDASFQTPLSYALVIDELSCDVSWNRATIGMAAELRQADKKTGLRAKGQYGFADQLLRGDVLVDDLDLRTYEAYLKNLPFAFEKAQLSGLKTDFSVDLKNAVSQGRALLDSADFSVKGPLTASGKLEKTTVDFSCDAKSVKLAADLNALGISAEIDAYKLSQADAEIHSHIEIPLALKEDSALSYEGTAKIDAAEISGIPQIGTVLGLASHIKFKNAALTIEDASAKVLDTEVTAKGDLKENILTLDLAGDFDLKKIGIFLPREMKLPAYEISGMTDLKMRLVSDVTAKSPPLIRVEALLKNVGLELPENKISLSSDEGRLKFDTQDQSLQWHFDAVRYLDQTYSCDGQLKDFKTPAISAMVIGKDIKLQAELTKFDDRLDIPSLKGQFMNSKFNLKGRWDFKEDLGIAGSILLDLADVKLQKGRLEGDCLIRLDASGPPKDYRLWRIQAKGDSKIIKGFGYRISDIEFDYSQIKQEGFINHLSFDAYGGKGIIRGRLDLLERSFTYALRGLLEGLDLNRLKFDTPLKDKTFFGTLFMKVSLQGRGYDPDSLKGGGSFAIKNGNVWEFNPLKGLGNFLFIPKFNSIVFTSAQGDFFVQDSYVSTDNLELLGPELGLLVEGKMTFAGGLDLLVNSQIPQPGPISKAGSLTAIRITGTAQEPKYKLQPIGANIMKKLSDIFSNMTP